MEHEEKKPFGYIYIATNDVNGKVYIGQTGTDRWGEHKVPIEERWKEEVGEAYSKERRGEERRYIENAIIKHGSENFNLREQDIASNQEDLDAKEAYWIKEYDSMKPEKGYNIKDGGRGGRLNDAAKEKLSKIGTEIWNKDSEYKEKQLKARKELAQNQEFIEKMTEVNQEIARNQETQKKMSESISKKWEEQQYQENVSKGATNKWQDAKHRERQFISRSEGKREIQDKREFLKDIQDMKKKDLNEKYDMDGKSINKRIKEILGHQGVNIFSEAKKYLEDKNLDEVLKEIHENLKDKSESFNRKKEISNIGEFLDDIQTMQLKDIAQKYNMNESTVNKRIKDMLGEYGVKNYTEAREYLVDKNHAEIVAEINERMSDQTQKYNRKTEISDKHQFLEDIQNLKKNELDHKYGMDAKTVNNKIKEMLGEHGVENYTDAREFLKNKNIDDVVKEIEQREAQNQKERTEPDCRSESPEDKPQKEPNEEEKPEMFEENGEEANKKATEISQNDKEEVPEKFNEQQENRGEKSLDSESKPEQETKHEKIAEKGSEDYKGLDKGVSENGGDYKDIDRPLNTSSNDIKDIADEIEAPKDGNDYDGIDKPQKGIDKDYDQLSERHHESGSKGGW
ncbi:MAG: hypothetical protein ACXADU_08990 [Promethearchaeota archaeon]|jgi:group I intron endonuclease